MSAQISNFGTLKSVSHGSAKVARISYEDAKNQYETVINNALAFNGDRLTTKVTNVANGQKTEMFIGKDLVQGYYLLSDRNGWVASWQSYRKGV